MRMTKSHVACFSYKTFFKEKQFHKTKKKRYIGTYNSFQFVQIYSFIYIILSSIFNNHFSSSIK